MNATQQQIEEFYWCLENALVQRFDPSHSDEWVTRAERLLEKVGMQNATATAS